MSSETEKGKLTCSFIVKNPKGLHARPSTDLAKCASAFMSQVVLHYQNLSINAKSLISILMLEIECGAEVTIEATGQDAKEALESIIKLAL
jgi:phosphocarrier protein